MAIHFISDLHLGSATPELNALFTKTLTEWQAQIEALYILGDLFEYWVGDDDNDTTTSAILAAMQTFATHTPLYVMHGNRDFLLGQGFAKRSGATLIDDPTLITVHQKHYLLTHGDALCTLDTAYQAFRALSRQPTWKQALLSRPLTERHALAREMRAMSKEQANNTATLFDVTEEAVQALLESYTWPTLIHGHTHRPAQHWHTSAAGQTARWVIADWHEAHGGYLRLDEQGISAHPLG